MVVAIEYGDDRLLAETALESTEPGLELVRRLFGLAVWGMDGLSKDDPMRGVISRVGTILTHALADSVAD